MGPGSAKQLVGITGTPGTGKKSIAPLVAARLGMLSLSLNELAETFGLLDRREDGSDVDTQALKHKMARVTLDPAVVYGHLLPYSLERRWVSKVVVLRCDPIVLRDRLEARGYPTRKVLENVESELISVISADSFKTFGREKTVEFDTTDSRPGPASTSIAKIISGKHPPRKRMDWLEAYDSVSRLRSLFSGAAEGSARTRTSTGL